MFGKKKQPQISKLNPWSYQRVQVSLESHGIEESIENISFAFGNAIYNTAMNYFHESGRIVPGGAFERKFTDRTPANVSAADEMVEFLLFDSKKNAEWLSTLIGRLEEVLSRPA